MSRIAVISIVLSVLTIQASGKSDFALELLKKAAFEEYKISPSFVQIGYIQILFVFS